MYLGATCISLSQAVRLGKCLPISAFLHSLTQSKIQHLLVMALYLLGPATLWCECQIMREARKLHICHGSLELMTNH